MPPKGKRNAANQHDKRHENGLAAPGKRIQKQKSNPALNGHVNGKPQPPTPPLRPDVTQHMTLPATPNGPSHGILADANMAGTVSGRCVDGRGRAVSDVSLDGLEACRYENTNGSLDHSLPNSPRRIDANGTRTASTYKGSNILTLTTTILSSCPLRDVLAILIILLQLPPTVLTIVHFLFATLTFVPPQTGTSLSAISALPSLTDIFQGSGGTPSLFTIVFADVFILILWLLLWVPVQNFFLDLAQAVIAISLGGAAAGRGGTTNSIFLCIVIIFCSHLFRFRPLRHHIVHFIWTGLSRGGLDFLTSPPTTPTYQESFFIPHGWPRSLLGIHILTQGVVRIIRRSLSRRESSQSMPTGKKADPEAAVPLQTPRSNSTSIDSSTDMASSSSTDGRPPGPSPAARDYKEKTTNGKKKRKQATHVRSQQPFWAALASTKVTVLKEMEQSQAANDAGEANAKDANHIGNAVFGAEGDRVWISEIGPTDISFMVSLYRGGDLSTMIGEECGANLRAGIDKSKPFYLRVNGADWSSTRIRETTTHSYLGDEGTDMWEGEIFGLTALTNYYCEFVRTADDEVFCSTSLITSAAPSAEQDSIAATPTHQTLRPSSPTTTLKNSIAAADQTLQDHRNRLKRNRKEHKTSIATIKKEVDALNNRLSTAGGSDDRQRQRALQFSQNIRQADDAAADFALQIDSLGDIPEDDIEEAATMKRAWQKERDNKSSVADDFDHTKAEANRQLANIQSEISSVMQRRERLQIRQTKLNEHHKQLIAVNTEGLNARTKRQQERAALLADHMSIESQYRSNINSYERRTTEYSNQNIQLAHTTQHLQALLQKAQQQQQQHSVPTTPEGVLPGTSALSGAFPAFHFPAAIGGAPHSGGNGGTPGSLYREGRGRSSSMLSNISGFTDALDEGPVSSPVAALSSNPFAAYVPHLNGRKGSAGSGSNSGSGSGNSSTRDPMSPVQRVLTGFAGQGAGRSSTPISPVGR